MNLKIIKRINSVEEEIEYTWNRVKRIKFYNERKYNLSLPENKHMQIIIEKSKCECLSENDKDHFAKIMVDDYNSEFYQAGMSKLKNLNIELLNFDSIYDQYTKNWGFKIFDEYTVRLTRYGPGGSYDYEKGHIILKVNEKGIASYRDVTEIILHEMIHIGIERAIVKKYALNHEEKERIVDKFITHHYKGILNKYVGYHDQAMTIDSYIEELDDWLNLSKQLALYCR